MAGWLSNAWEWDWFYSLTFDPTKALRNASGSIGHSMVGWSGSDRRFRDWAAELDARSPIGSVYWVRSREPNPNRPGTHFHGLIGGVGTLRRDAAWRAWFDRNGMARIEPIAGVRSKDAVSLYVSKYVMKDQGEMTFSPNLGLHRRVK